MTPPRVFSALPPYDSHEASPKAVSGRTSYLRVRLEFLPYPHLIATLFNGCAFGPPLPFTATSSWTWIDHPVSGLRMLTFNADHVGTALLRLGFPSAPGLKPLTLPAPATRRTVLQKVRGPPFGRCPTVCGHRVSGSLSLPSRGSFHLSFTVLCSIGHWVVFSLTGWSPLIPTRFHVSRGTLDPALSPPPSLTGLSPSMAGLSRTVLLGSRNQSCSPNPGMHASRFGLFPFRSPLLRESIFFLFLRLLRCFSSPGSPRTPMDSVHGT